MKHLLHGKLHGENNGYKNQSPLTSYWRWVFLSSLILLVTVAPAAAPPPPLVVSFSGTPTTGFAPLHVSFNDSSTGGPTGWAWFFGDETFTGPWTLVNASSGWTARLRPSSVALPDGSIVLMGGTEDGNIFKNDVWRSTNKGITWTQVNASAGWTARYYHSSVAMPDGSIVLMGGYDNIDGKKNDVWRSTDKGVTWTQVNASAGWLPRYGQSSVALPDGSIVLMGGNEQTIEEINDVWRSTDRGVTWTQVNASAGWTGRYEQSSVVMPDGSIVLMGGQNGGTYYNDVWRSMDNGAMWTKVNASAGWLPRVTFSSVSMPDGSIILMGGNTKTESLKHDVWRSTDKGVTWTQVNASAGWTVRRGHSSVALPDGSIVLTGGEAPSGYMNDTWRFQPTGSSAKNLTHTYIIPGIYQVALQAYNTNGFNSTRKAGYITAIAPRPNITAISPTKGPTAGGTRVTLTGTGFTGATAVRFGTTAGTGLTVNSSTRITITSPAHAAGPVNVKVTTPGGTSALVAGDRFTYAARPTVTAISPASGPTAGGTWITLTGTSFTNATAVRFGTTAGTRLTVNSSTKITIRSPAHAAGTVYVKVTTPGGTSANASANRFMYVARPNVTTVSPASGPTAGGTRVTVTGTGFTGATAVRFGPTAGTSLTVNSSTRITVTSPAHAAGPVNVMVTTPGGTSAIVAGDRFTYSV